MAHEIYESDHMISVLETPWHGLGTVLKDYPTVAEAIIASKLGWSVQLQPIKYESVTEQGFKRMRTVTDQKLLVRSDTGQAVSIVGNGYVPYQNAQMWEFIETFMDATGGKIETAGSLFQGRVVWVLVKNDTIEYIKGDPIEKYFLFKNNYTGNQCVEVLFTDTRVVCNNTLTWAINDASNIYKVRHTAGMEMRLAQVQEVLGFRTKFDMEMADAMEVLTRKEMRDAQMREAMDWVLSKKNEDDEDSPDAAIEVALPDGGEIVLEQTSDRSKARRENIIDEIMNLVETGAGSDIPGVKGTAYGLLQAAVEYSDHYKTLSPRTKTVTEAKFENAFGGSGGAFKQRTFDFLVKM